MDEKLHNIRHTLAHLLAASVLEFYPKAKLTLGPAIDNGFYYDIDFGKIDLKDLDLKEIEKSMKKKLSNPDWKTFSHFEVSEKEALKEFKSNEYKEELIKEIVARGEKITIYQIGTFKDLCRGGHVENTGEIDPKGFMLDRVAGAYWRGDEKNPMLTRIYGLAFATQKDLDEYLTKVEEAKKRDHKKLGVDLDLFFIDEKVGKGLPLWTPKGTAVKFELEDRKSTRLNSSHRL